MKRTRSSPFIVLFLTILALCFCLLGGAVLGWLVYQREAITSLPSAGLAFGTPTSTPQLIRPTLASTLDEPGQGLQARLPYDTLEALENTIAPTSSLRDLARRLEGKQDIPLTMEPPVAYYTVGAQKSFWATNVDTIENFQISATLRYVTDHLYFWVEDGVQYRETDLQNLAETFEHQIYPTNREFFGSEWIPGVDGDPHLYILYARGLGSGLAGYYSSADQYHPLAHPYSNAHEMFFLSADNMDLGSEATYSVLAHEFQHMIHWHQDRNEETWMNEGFSELAAFLNGYGGSGFARDYASNPDLQLNTWPNNGGSSGPHYGAAFLFLAYFLDRFGDEATKSLVAHPDNGMASIDKVLAELDQRDALTGELIGADDIFLDWILANYLKDGSLSDGRYTYHNYPQAPQASPTETIRNCPHRQATHDVHQYGVDYIRITCSGDYSLYFEGSTQVSVVPTGSYSGEFAYWSNRGDESNMTLTRSFDFREHEGPLTLNYWTWYDIEEGYDYLYLLASPDGENWQILTTPSGTAENPSGNSYGWGYNGISGGGSKAEWIEESVDISQFAGQEVRIRFKYVTDAAVNGEGFLLDDVSIPEIGYFTDFEESDSSWEMAGWVRIDNLLPQSYRLALISFGDTVTVEKITLADDNTALISLNLGSEVDEAVLAVSGTTRYTRQKAPYRFEIRP